MTAERELLKQVVENFAYVQDMHLIVAIQKLLNQPEQEPVAPEQGLYDCGLGQTPTKEVSDELS